MGYTQGHTRMVKRRPAVDHPPGREALLQWVARRPDGLISFHTLVKEFQVPVKARRALQRQLEQLVGEGRLLRRRGRRYQRVDVTPSTVGPGQRTEAATAAGRRERAIIIGRLWRHPDGFGFVTPEAVATGEQRRDPDIFISRQGMANAVHGDRVEVQLLPTTTGRPRRKIKGPARRDRSVGDQQRLRGRIHRVVEREYPRVVGRYYPTPHGGVVIPLDERSAASIPVMPAPPSEPAGAEPPVVLKRVAEGSLVAGELSSTGRLSVRVTRDFGPSDRAQDDTDIVIEQYALPTTFSERARHEADRLPATIAPETVTARRDLRALPTFTIDGEQARDFDDAISIEQTSSGYCLWVHIADVGHYVPWGSAIDGDARIRGTSVYFPDRAVPMLPERLSNDLCSLNPFADRLALTAEIHIDREGRRTNYDLYESLIRSDARFTYPGVATALTSEEPDEPYRSLRPQLQLVADLATRLQRRRMARGSLDFDLPEPEIVLDLQGRPTDILKEERTIAHRLIEECMLAANETVAEHLTGLGAPLLYRIHEPPDPDKLAAFRLFAQSIDFSVTHGRQMTSASLQALLDAARGHPEERLLNHLLLRTMKRARYGPEPLGHFGLASPCYTHFTSPIRRYPDLVVHRILKVLLAKDRLTPEEHGRLVALLPELGRSSSERERVAMEAEWEVIKIKKARFMAERLGEVYHGYITGVAKFGLFVEPESIFVEGLVPTRTLPRDHYQFIEEKHTLYGERSRRRFRLGDPIVVQVAGVNIDRRQVNFILAE